MNIEGIWKVEIQGPYNREPFSTVFLENGRYLGSSADRYSIGRYQEHDGVFKAKVVINQHGVVRTMFGTKKERVKVRVEGTVSKKGDKLSIHGTARPSKSKDKRFEVGIHFTRLATLD